MKFTKLKNMKSIMFSSSVIRLSPMLRTRIRIIFSDYISTICTENLSELIKASTSFMFEIMELKDGKLGA